MSTIDITAIEKRSASVKSHAIDDEIRQRIIHFAKNFKTSWVGLGQTLFAVYQDKLYYSWGYEKFDEYIEQEVGINKTTAKKLLKSYIFVETEEPSYVDKTYPENRTALEVPGYEEINFLRLAKNSKDMNSADYVKLKKDIFESGKVATDARKDLTQMMKERKEVDPEEERENRRLQSLRKVIHSLRSFYQDMEASKLVPANLIEETKGLLTKMEKELD